eukprot:SAG22_NODE_18171_length_292_cov_0.367876_1_plen_39_part_10
MIGLVINTHEFIAWNDSSHSILNEFMRAEYGIFVYTIWP